MSDNLDNLLGDIYSSSSQSQGVKELANLINNLSSLLLNAITQLESRVTKLEQQVAHGGTPRPPQPSSPAPPPTTRAPMPKAASPFSAPSTPPPPPPKPAPAATASGGPGSAVEAASMLGVTLKKAPAKTASAAAPDSGPSFLTGVVNPDAPAETSPGGAIQPDAVAPTMETSGGGIAAPGGGFRGELAEKLANRRQKVAQQIEDDFDAPDLAVEPGEEVEVVEDSASSELKLDLEDELRSAFSKLKG